jgi:fucose 4-O-acetylase-like acetyltransferase
MKDLDVTMPGRLYYLDNLRILLIILVILQHLTVTYGAPGSWDLKFETDDVLTLVVFSLFNAVNQSFFMGFFFLLSGYFTPDSYDRKGGRRFMLDRLLRLGIPLAIYDMLISPNVSYLINIFMWGWDNGWISYMRLYYREGLVIGSGPLWYVEKLLLFQVMYILGRELVGYAPKLQSKFSLPGWVVIGLFALVIGGATFVMRIWLPYPENIDFLTLECPFFPPLYFSLFLVGILAYRGNWFKQISQAMGKCGWGIALILIGVVFPPLFYWGGAREGNFSVYMGGWQWQALVYAMWEPFVGIGIIIGLLVLFRDKYNRGGRLLHAMAGSTYTVYIIHGPILVMVGLIMKDMVWHPLVKFVLGGVVSVPICFLLGYLIRCLPVARKIL